MKTCKNISELLSEGMERRLTWNERLEVRVHIFMCSSCYRFHEQIGFLRKAAVRYNKKY